MRASWRSTYRVQFLLRRNRWGRSRYRHDRAAESLLRYTERRPPAKSCLRPRAPPGLHSGRLRLRKPSQVTSDRPSVLIALARGLLRALVLPWTLRMSRTTSGRQAETGGGPGTENGSTREICATNAGDDDQDRGIQRLALYFAQKSAEVSTGTNSNSIKSAHRLAHTLSGSSLSASISCQQRSPSCSIQLA